MNMKELQQAKKYLKDGEYAGFNYVIVTYAEESEKTFTLHSWKIFGEGILSMYGKGVKSINIR